MLQQYTYYVPSSFALHFFSSLQRGEAGLSLEEGEEGRHHAVVLRQGLHGDAEVRAQLDGDLDWEEWYCTT